MKIGLNGQRISINNPAGPEKYTINIFTALAKIDHDNEYVVYVNQKPDKDLFNSIKGDNPHFSYKIVSSDISWTQVGLALELVKYPIDVFFSSVHTLPIFRKSSLKTIGMIHGLEYKYSKEYENPIKKKFIYWPQRYVCQKADSVIVPSNATKEAILKENWRGIDKNKITIVYEGVGEEFYKRRSNEVGKIRGKYKIRNDPYIIAVSTIQPRKNYIAMIEGFSMFIKENSAFPDLKLLIAGKNGWNYKEVLEAPKRFGIEDSVQFLGRVPDKDLPILYSGAEAYISTSLEEGFGLPLLEALACEIPAIVSDIPAYREVGSYYPIFINPKEPESIKKSLTDLFINKPNKNIMNKAKQYARSFTWENSAEKILEIMKNLVIR
ncbi:glycosyltransferase family 4 protein [Patescibacteria group bacterium]|nr:glycosyltransferase family 4 protein [Patescibacteria group bacterium]